MNKQLWKSAISDGLCPQWPCPSCKAGVLTLTPGSLQQKSTKSSFLHQGEDWWGPEYIELLFTAWATCSNNLCNETFALSGRGGVEQVPDEDYNSSYEDYFRPLHCHPTLELIRLPANCPEHVEKALKAAFALYWVDRPSSAGRIRVALERLLDHLGIAAHTSTGGYLSLDKRIDTFSQNDPANGPQMMALKWLGNVGSHTIDIQTDDLLSAFEVLEHLMSELIEKKSAYIAKAAAELLAKYKP
jgi:hypothetical protein